MVWKNHKKKRDLQRIDYVIPVPLHPKKLKKRGYNQVDLFSKCIAKELQTKFLGDALIKTANTKTQTKKSRIFRLDTNENLYKINSNYDLNGARILLTDDVVTTGATIEACANALHQYKNIEIYVATMAFVPKLGS